VGEDCFNKCLLVKSSADDVARKSIKANSPKSYKKSNVHLKEKLHEKPYVD